MPKLSSGFKTGALVADGGVPMVVESGSMTLATGGAGDLNNGLTVIPHDMWIKEWFLYVGTNSTGTKANAKLSVGHAGDDDAFLDSLALATGAYGNLLATTASVPRMYRFPVATDVWAARKITAGQRLEFNLDALALTATNEVVAGVILDGNG